ncbi:amidohydrolase [Sutterella sp.]|uniref:amidohydrolase n=1 Tax=Sutterella sp. TaxID=1981025 RepID=UPI0026DFB75F|nr:amidohydrolase [Sutterella sp.]MDO5532612.1 amidohydrolase [Sutterella sp.]
MTLQDLMAKYGDYQIEMRRYFHQHPEESTKEVKTAERIRAELDQMGIPWRVCGMPTGTLARIEGKEPGRTIMLRGDIDALSVTEETGLPFASCNPGVMHACGHDCHISMLLTAAKMLSEIKDQLKGTVVLCFQPAEEIGRGADAMVKDGALEGVDACFGMHVWADVKAGQVGMHKGATMASADQFTIRVHGFSGHGSAPHQTVDAAVMASSIVMNLQTMVSREYAPIDTAVVTVGKIVAGTRFNVIAGEAVLEGTTRTFSPKIRNGYHEVLGRIASNTAAAFRGTAEVEYNYLVPITINDSKMIDVAAGAGRKIFGDDGVVDCEPTMGGEDFAYYQEKIPGAMVLLGINNPECKATYPQHHGRYTVDESVLIKGAALHVQTALDFLGVELH